MVLYEYDLGVTQPTQWHPTPLTLMKTDL
jgi:hypothetical protein